MLSDLLFDVAPFYAKLEQARFVIVRQAEPLFDLATGLPAPDAIPALRFENCLECGLCVSACPVPGSDPGYLGLPSWRPSKDDCSCVATSRRPLCWPSQTVSRGSGAATPLSSARKCPSDAEPGTLMMALRRRSLARQIARFFGQRSAYDETR